MTKEVTKAMSGKSTTPHRLYRCEALLTSSGWMEPAVVAVDAKGQIISVSADVPANAKAAVVESIAGAVVPGFQNAHSHAFQYAMAGHAEHLPKGAGRDDFWSWREAMYRLALSVSPEQVKAIASLLYAEMLRHGYTSVAEFHYLHRDVDGQPYSDEALLGRCLVAAAEQVGIRLTLVPVWYQHGGFGAPAQPHQRRFLCPSLDAYMQLLEASQRAVDASPLATLGMGIHSLRAVAPEDAKLAFAQVDAAMPKHLHVAEQQQEVDAALVFLRTRPVQWLLDNLLLDQSFHLVHATHLDDAEVAGLAASRAHVVLCPSTEGNLGDGFFPLRSFVEKGGRWSIGTDSHIGLDPHEELRWLDYGQRLALQKRNVLCQEPGDDSAMIAFSTAWHAGRAAMGAAPGDFWTPGQPFDAVVYDLNHPLLVTTPISRRLATLLYSFGSERIAATIVGGKRVVDGQKHHRWDEIVALYLQVM